MSKILGYEDLRKNLRSLSKIDDTMESSVRSWTGYVKETAKEIVPVQTGELRDSISDDYDSGNSSIAGSVFTEKEYGPDVELGIGQEAHPFLYPALYRNQGEIVSGIASDIADGIAKLVKL